MKRNMIALLALAIAGAFTSTRAESLPMPSRAFPVEGGWIAVQGGAMKNPETPPLAVGKMRYPIRYWLRIENETASPIWLDVEWRFPDDKPKKTTSKQQVAAGDHWSFWRNKFDLIAGEPIQFRIQVFSDEARSRLLGTVDSDMRFLEEERELIRGSFQSTKTNLTLIGWPEMKTPLQEVPGTNARGLVPMAIQQLLWKEESKRFLDCEHRVVRAERFQPEVSANLLALSERSRKSAEEARARGDLIFERWLMRSCANLTTYEVLITKDQFDKTEIRAEMLSEQMTEQAAADAAAPSPAMAASPSPTLAGSTITELTAPAKGPFDSRAWRQGYAARTPQREITEYVLPGEIVEAWTELVTVSKMPGIAERMTPQEFMKDLRKATLKQCPSTTWTVLRQEKEEVLYQWEHRECGGFGDEFEVAKIYRDGAALVRVAWDTKKLPVTEEMRASWIKIIGEYPGNEAGLPSQ